MKYPRHCLLLATVLWCSWGYSDNPAPQPIHPEQAQWASPPALPGVQGAWLLGAERNSGIYQFRVRLEPGAKIPPHTHPDERNSTVLKGTLYVGFGQQFDDSNLVAIPQGAIYVAPANVPHYLWAKDVEVIYQESGMGPSATHILPGATQQP